MTFPDQEAVSKNCCDVAPVEKKLTVALKAAFKQALKDGRVTYGAYDCAKLLEVAHDSVMLCVLAGSENPDVTVIIQHTLMEAFCWEQGIPLLKVGSGKQLANILCLTQAVESPNGSSESIDVSCALLQPPTKGFTKAEKALWDLYGQSVSSKPEAFPVLELNV